MAFPRKEKLNISKTIGSEASFAKLGWIQYQQNILLHFKGNLYIYCLDSLKFESTPVNLTKYPTPDKLNRALVTQYNENIILLYSDNKIVQYDTYQHKFLPDRQTSFKATGKYGMAIDRGADHLVV